jgi:hypothetical protein
MRSSESAQLVEFVILVLMLAALTIVYRFPG